jgi:[ribosomal protein S18]-alanine N-acetyltransferase
MERVDTAADATMRPMRAEDVDAVIGIENRQFTSPWDASTFLDLIDRPSAELWVAEHPEAGVIAYAVLWCIVDQGELANVAVRPEYAGLGYARRLLDGMFVLAKGRGIETVFLEVRSSNARATELYRSFGFTDVGRRKNYYEKPREDAVVMRLTL